LGTLPPYPFEVFGDLSRFIDKIMGWARVLRRLTGAEDYGTSEASPISMNERRKGWPV
jgi:hypothetical protein